jgi:hypothetical protein
VPQLLLRRKLQARSDRGKHFNPAGAFTIDRSRAGPPPRDRAGTTLT